MPRNAIGSGRSFFSGLSVFCRLLVLTLGAAALLCACLLTLKTLIPELQHEDMLMFISALGCMLLLFALLLGGSSDGWGWFALILIAAFAARLYYIMAVPTQPVSDFKLLADAARQSAAGDYSWARVTGGYFYNWAYQIPFVLYQSLMLRLSNSLLAIELLNVFFMTGSCALVYAIAIPAGRRAALCAMLLYAVYPDVIQLSSVLTNQHVSTFFLLLAVLLLSYKSYVSVGFAGLSLGVSYLLRPEAAVLAVAAVYMAVWLAARDFRANWKRVLLKLLVLFGVFLLTVKGTELYLIYKDIAPSGIGNRAPEWKLILGLNFASGGGYSEQYSSILSIPDHARRWAATRELIAESFRACESPASFFAGKCTTMWAFGMGNAWSGTGVDAAATLMGGRFTVAQLWRWLAVINYAVYPLIWLGALLAVPLLRRDSDKADIFRFILIAFIGFFIFYLLTEVQGRYRYSAVSLAVLLSVPFFSHINRCWNEKK